MQKVFNVLGLLGFIMSATLTGASIAAFTRIPSMLEQYVEQVYGDVTGKVEEILPGEIEEAMPELPTSTGPAVPFQMP